MEGLTGGGVDGEGGVEEDSHISGWMVGGHTEEPIRAQDMSSGQNVLCLEGLMFTQQVMSSRQSDMKFRRKRESLKQ